MTQDKSHHLRTALVLGANGYIGNAVARAFVRSGWITYGLIRSPQSAHALATEEILPVIGSIDDRTTHSHIHDQLPPALDAIVSTTEDHSDYVGHYDNIVHLLRSLSQRSLVAPGSTGGTKPLVIFTSGCKDYGPGPHYATDPALAPHTEESPLQPPALLALRATYARRILEHADDNLFSPVLVRPTNVHGRSASFYGLFFDVAQQYQQQAAATAATTAAEATAEELVVPVRPDSICHSLHVDDCGDAYVALASHPDVAQVAGQVFNISARRYETVDEIARALVAEYGFAHGVRYQVPPVPVPDPEQEPVENNPWPPYLIDFPQWTGSDKIRRVTGWTDHRPLFAEAVHVYRVAYEAAKTAGHENVVRVQGFMSQVKASSSGGEA